MVNALSYIVNETRLHDRDRFLCSIFAPKGAREGLFTVLAFNIEIAKTREMVRENLIGEIRLQWWRDVIELIFNNPSDININHLVAGELATVIEKFTLSRSFFDLLIDARSRDLVDSPLENEADLKRYSYETSSTLCKILLEILCPIDKVLSSSEVEAAESVGMAWALTGILRASTTLAKQKRVLIPKTLMKEFGFNNAEFYGQNATNGILEATAYIVDLARTEIAHARRLLKDNINRRYIALLLQASLAELYLNKIEFVKFNPFSTRIEDGRTWRQLKIAVMAARGSF